MYHRVTGVERVEWSSNDEYHRHPAISSSRLRDFVEHGVTWYRAMHVDRTLTVEPTARMELGSLLHEAVLCPEWARPITVIPEEVLAKNGAKSTNAYRDFAREHEGNWLLKRHETDHLAAMIASIRGHELARKLLFPSDIVDTEVALMNDTLRCRIDAIGPLGIADLKLHDDLNPQHLARHIVAMRYDWQLAFYAAIAGGIPMANDCYLVFVRSIYPFQCRVIRLQPSWIEAAQREYLPVLGALQRRHAMEDWSEPDAHSAIELERPKWADYRDDYILSSESEE